MSSEYEENYAKYLSGKERRYLNDTQKARLANERRTGEPKGQPFNTYDYFFKPEVKKISFVRR